jgi:hypothetical protein
VWTRTGNATQAQPSAQIPRVSGLATFVWIGHHPATATPVVTLQYESTPGTYTDVRRRSGRLVQDGDLLLYYTQQPMRPDPGDPLTHYWVAEWQAVPWIGAGAGGGLDTLDNRVAVPAGNYRFHVEHPSYEIYSDPFEVIPATLAVTATKSGTDVVATARTSAPKGWRLMHMDLASNGSVPVRNGTFDVTLTLSGGGTLEFNDLAGDAGGRVTAPAGAEIDNVTSVTVTDAHGNTGTAAL